MTPLRHHLKTLLLVVAGGTVIGAGLAAFDRYGNGLGGSVARRAASQQHDGTGPECQPYSKELGHSPGSKTHIDPALQMASLERDLPQGVPQRPVVKMARTPQRTGANEAPQVAPPVIGTPTVRAAAPVVIPEPDAAELVVEDPMVPPAEPQPAPRGPDSPVVRMAEAPATTEPWDMADRVPKDQAAAVASEPAGDIPEMPETVRAGLRLLPRRPMPVFGPPPVMNAEDIAKDLPQARPAVELGVESGTSPAPVDNVPAQPSGPRSGPVVYRAPRYDLAPPVTPRGVPLPSEPMSARHQPPATGAPGLPVGRAAPLGPAAPAMPVARSAPAMPVGPMAPTAPATAPYMMVVARRAQEHINYGIDLAERGAFYSSESEFTQALLLIAQALDASENTQLHGEAMASGLRALKEADEFVARDASVPLDIGRIAAAHKTPVLKPAAGQGIAPLVAMQQYYTYAQTQLALAGGHEPTAATALYGLARLQGVTNSQNDVQRMMCGPKAIALHQAALSVDPAHYKAANELGVLLVRYGQWSDAQAAFLQSARFASNPETWQSLAHVYRHLGDERAARSASEQAQAALAQRRASGGSSGDRPQVRYVDPEAFVRDSGGPESDDVARAEPAPQAGAGATSTAPTPPPPAKTQSGPIGWIKSKAAGLTRTARVESNLQAQK
ncbi:MAG: hypothetical protein HYX69_02725 [Planctomycetia bacterium]|nr:hypothetical protein [Planctomycetia bacterium]